MGVAEGQEGGRAAPLTWALTWLSGSHLTAASSCARRFSSSDTCGVWGEGLGPQCGASSQVWCPPTGRPCGASSPPAHLGRLGKLVLLRPPVELEGDGIAGRGGGPGGALPRCRFAALGHLQLLQQPPGDRREGTRWARDKVGMGAKGEQGKRQGTRWARSLSQPHGDTAMSPQGPVPHSLGQGTLGVSKVNGGTGAQHLLQVGAEQLLLQHLHLPGQGHGRELLLSPRLLH